MTASGADLLREAAAKMRECWTGPGHIAETFRAVADWLDAEVEDHCQSREAGPRRRDALTTARAYLGRTP